MSPPLPRQERRTYAVWEITTACNLACQHCGSRAGRARPDELSTDESLDVVRQLAELGIAEVTLIGGEAFLRKDFLTLARAIDRAGMACTLTTGGYGISAELARRMVDAGIRQVSVSLDGLEETHDRLRGRTGSWRSCLASLEHLGRAGMALACNTQLNRLTVPELARAYRVQRDAGMRAWQLQMTVPMGNAADHPEILLQPPDLLDLFPRLSRLKDEADGDGVLLIPGNNVGYYGPYERRLRGLAGGRTQVWPGCHAGLNTLGLEADGTVKGCPSLPTGAYGGGNVRERTLEEIILQSPALNLKVGAPTSHLWGFCASCEYAGLCRGGCTWTAHVFFDRPGNNPYCHHRALELAARGVQERLDPERPAPGRPFDNGRFRLAEEPLAPSRRQRPGFTSPWLEGDGPG